MRYKPWILGFYRNLYEPQSHMAIIGRTIYPIYLYQMDLRIYEPGHLLLGVQISYLRTGIFHEGILAPTQ